MFWEDAEVFCAVGKLCAEFHAVKIEDGSADFAGKIPAFFARLVFVDAIRSSPQFGTRPAPPSLGLAADGDDVAEAFEFLPVAAVEQLVVAAMGGKNFDVSDVLAHGKSARCRKREFEVDSALVDCLPDYYAVEIRVFYGEFDEVFYVGN